MPMISGETPLFYAIEMRQRRLVELLLDHGADVNHRYKRGVKSEWWPMSLEVPVNAARLENDPCAYDLTDYERTPLMHAARHGNVEIPRAAVKRGARLRTWTPGEAMP